MHAVRKHILEILKETGGATVAELAERLDMAPVSVRHHLDILQGDNLIRVGRVERTGSVGRPQQIYQLTDDAAELFPKNFALLAAGMVRQLKQLLPPEQVDAVFHALADEMAEEVNLTELETLPPVSYTHLDVYKRQPFPSPQALETEILKLYLALLIYLIAVLDNFFLQFCGHLNYILIIIKITKIKFENRKQPLINSIFKYLFKIVLY